ncbi:kinase-like protein [Lentinula edodes]|nr:kinase-like protein [Lentinula edodes]
MVTPRISRILTSLASRVRLALYFLLTFPPDLSVSSKTRRFRFGIPLILKRSHFPVSTETDALRFLHATNLDLPIPRIYDTFTVGDDTYTLLGLIPGVTLFNMLQHHNLSSDDLAKIMDDLTLLVQKLWTIRQRDYPSAPQGFVSCSASGHGLPDYAVGYELRGPRTIFEQYKERTYHLAYDITAWDNGELRRQEPQKAALVTNDEIVWVHCDLRSTNIMIHDGRVSGVIDWENSGWQPRHWQLLVVRPWCGTNGPRIANAWKQIPFDDDVEQAYEAGLSLLNEFV